MGICGKLGLKVYFAIALLISSTGGAQTNPWEHWYHPIREIANGCCYGANNWVVVGNGGTITTSSDGTNWNILHVDEVSYLTGVAYGNGTYLAVGFNPSQKGISWLSSNGVAWSPGKEEVAPFKNVLFANGAFYRSAANTVEQSTNGIDWKLLLSVPHTCCFNSCAFGNGTLVVAGTDRAFILTNGTTNEWPYGNWVRINNVTFGASLFLAVGEIRTSAGPPMVWEPVLFSSSDTVHWYRSNLPKIRSEALAVAAFADGHYIALGAMEGEVLVSDDATTWQLETPPGHPGVGLRPSGICFGAHRFLVAGPGSGGGGAQVALTY